MLDLPVSFCLHALVKSQFRLYFLFILYIYIYMCVYIYYICIYIYIYRIYEGEMDVWSVLKG